VRRFILFNEKRHRRDMGPDKVAGFLTYLAVERRVAPATQGQAKWALLVLYRVVLNVDLPWLDELVAARNRRRLSVVLTPGEVRRLLAESRWPRTSASWERSELHRGPRVRRLPATSNGGSGSKPEGQRPLQRRKPPIANPCKCLPCRAAVPASFRPVTG
jgi:hypothetical protein